MKTVFIVLLIAAIGGGVYYFVTKNKPSVNITKSSPEEMIIGKWKIDSFDYKEGKDSSFTGLALFLALKDSALYKAEFEFQKDGILLERENKNVTDTTHYQFLNDSTLATWSRTDTVKTNSSIKLLDSTSLTIAIKDSLTYFLKKVR
jgi:hypothetical protein